MGQGRVAQGQRGAVEVHLLQLTRPMLQLWLAHLAPMACQRLEGVPVLVLRQGPRHWLLEG